MTSEVINIIKNGLMQNKNQVIKYSELLAENLEKKGDFRFSKRIKDTLNNTENNKNTVTLDKLNIISKDIESQMDLIHIIYPSEIIKNIYLSGDIKNSISFFMNKILKKSELNSKGVDVKNSLLMFGPPGCGKTTIAQYIAKELDVPLVIMKLDSIMSSYLGSTSKNLTKVFNSVKNKKCILFLDEFDAIAKARDDQQELGELKRIVNSLLQNIDEYITDGVLIAATNHENLLDKAIWRRFHDKIHIDILNGEERTHLIEHYLNKYNLQFDNKNIKFISELYSNKTHSEIENLITNTYIKSIIENISISIDQLVYDFYLSEKMNRFDEEECVQFMRNKSIAIEKISKITKLSTRKVRNYIDLKIS